MNDDKSIGVSRRSVVAGLAGAGLWIACTNKAEPQPVKEGAKGAWRPWVSRREGLAEAHLDLAVPGHIFSTLKGASHYSFVLCGHELFSCASGNDATGNRDLHGSYVIEPKAEHELRVFARLDSGEYVRQTQTIALNLSRKCAFRTLSVRLNSRDSFVATVKELAPKFDDFFKHERGDHSCNCSVRG